jgi:hypothetical protein
MNKAIKFFSADRIFLVDGLGAAICLAVYSLSCKFLKPQRWQLFLRCIALLNLAYGCASLVFMYLFRETLTAWGVTYFI